jgi:diketogulonate reductase-like aldo/keto reductase
MEDINGLAQHAVVATRDGKVWDFTGPHLASEYLSKFASEEGLNLTGYRPLEEDDFEDSLHWVHRQGISEIKSLMVGRGNQTLNQNMVLWHGSGSKAPITAVKNHQAQY